RSNAVLPRGGKYKDCAPFHSPLAKGLAQQRRLHPLRTLDCIDSEASQMQRVELARVARAHGTIDRLRLGDPAHPMQRFSLVDGRHLKRMSWRVTAARPSRQMIATFVRTDTPRHGLRTDAAERQRSSRRRNLRSRPRRVRKRPGWPEIACPRPW